MVALANVASEILATTHPRRIEADVDGLLSNTALPVTTIPGAPSQSASIVDQSFDLRRTIHDHRTVISASSAAIIGTCLGFPFDSLKTRLQTQNFPSMAACVQHTFKTEGFRGFFRGMLPPLLTVSFFKSAAFSVYVNAKTTLSKTIDPIHFKLAHAHHLGVVSLVSGCCSGAFTAVVTQPLELIKVLRQLEKTSSPKTGLSPRGFSSIGMAREVVRIRGFMGLGHGFCSHLIREALGSSIYFSSYELSKHYMTSLANHQVNSLIHLLSGGTCGILAWIVIFPADVVKSSIQRDTLSTNPQFTSFRQCTRELWARGGLRQFYRGISATLVRAAPIHALNWLIFEKTLELCTLRPQ